MPSKKSLKYATLSLIAFFLIASLPFIRSFFITNVVELLMSRKLRDFSHWDNILQHSIYLCIYLLGIFYFLGFTKFGNQISEDIKSKFKEIFTKKETKRNLLVLAGIFAVSFFALIHADYNYADDLRRSYTGERSWIGSSRYISEILSIFIHTNIRINDISPLTQIWAIIFITSASFFSAYSFSDGNVTLKTLVPASFIGLSPFFIANLAYKFDSPYMAMAILFGVFPFLFYKNEKSYIFTSFFCIIGACISYQAGTSIYIVFTAVFALLKWNRNENLKSVFRFAGISILCFAISLFVFKFFFLNTKSDIDTVNYNNLAQAQNIFSAFRSNLKNYLKAIFDYSGNLWCKFFLAADFMLFIFVSVSSSKRNKNASLALSVFVLAFIIVFSFGAYLILAAALIHARAFMGFTAVIAAVSLFNLLNSRGSLKRASFICSLFLFHGFIVYDTVFGNVMAKQKDYENFRTTVLLSDLSGIINPSEKNSFYIREMPGWGENSQTERRNYNIPFVNLSPALSHYLLNNYNMDFDVFSEDYFEALPQETQEMLLNLPVIKDTYYHKISGSGNIYYIYLKHPEKR